MQQMMKKMGISQTEIPAKEVIIKMDEGDIIITNPTVSKVNLMGQETFQITGEIHEKGVAEITDDDIKTVTEQAGTTAEKARQALEEHNGDIAAAILELKNQ